MKRKKTTPRPPHPYEFVLENLAESVDIKKKQQFGSNMIYARQKVYFCLFNWQEDPNYGLWIATEKEHWPQFEGLGLKPCTYLPSWLVLPPDPINGEYKGEQLVEWAVANRPFMGKITPGSLKLFGL